MTFFQLWNDASHNMIDEFDTEDEALEEVRARCDAACEAALNLSLVRYDDPDTPIVVALGPLLVRRAMQLHPSHVATDD